MRSDLGLEPTRKVRKEISHEHDNNPRRLVEYYMEYQRRFSDRLRWAHDGDKQPKGAAEQGDSSSDAAHQ